MSYLMAIFMGLIQGVAEFLPISSSGHLALFQRFFGMENLEETHMFFTILLHFGTLLSVCVVYWQDVIDMVREFFLGVASLFSRRRGREAPSGPAACIVGHCGNPSALCDGVGKETAGEAVLQQHHGLHRTYRYRLHPVLRRPYGPGT